MSDVENRVNENKTNQNQETQDEKIENMTLINSIKEVQQHDNMEKWHVLIRLMKMLQKGFWLYLAAIIGMSVAMSLFDTVAALLLKEIMQMAQMKDATGLFGKIGWNLLGGIGALLLYQAGFCVYMIEAKKGCANIQRAILFHATEMPYAYYENSHSGDFISKVMFDGDRASDIYGSRFRRILMPCIMVICILIPMFLLSWQVTGCLLVICVMTSAVNTLFVNPEEKIGREISRKHASLMEQLTNILSGIDVIKMFQLDKTLVLGYRKLNDEYVAKQKQQNLLNACLQGLNQCFDLISSIAFIAVGVYFVSQHITTIDKLAAIYVLYGTMSWNFMQIGLYIPDMANCLANAERVFEFLDLEAEPKRYQIPAASKDYYIVMEHVDFSYDGKDNILQDFSMSVQLGETVALKAESGKGKSTIAKILLGFYDIQKGNITIGGKGFGEQSLAEIRNQISYVPQEPYLYNISIADNIRMGRPEATQKEIEQAARLANAHNFILRQQDGYQTLAGERGNHLSGGERQRIAIARAILKNAPILILDEATSALDNESERLVSEAIEHLSQGKTTIMIAHRISTLQRADRIITIA